MLTKYRYPCVLRIVCRFFHVPLATNNYIQNMCKEIVNQSSKPVKRVATANHIRKKRVIKKSGFKKHQGKVIPKQRLLDSLPRYPAPDAILLQGGNNDKKQNIGNLLAEKAIRRVESSMCMDMVIPRNTRSTSGGFEKLKCVELCYVVWWRWWVIVCVYCVFCILRDALQNTWQSVAGFRWCWIVGGPWFGF